jgi:hypothetical protein
MAYIRHDAKSTVLVVLNLSLDHHKIKISHEKLRGKFLNVFSGFTYTIEKEVSFELMAGDYFVYAIG